MYSHPSWCDPSLCTADPTAVSIGLGGQHRSAAVSLNLLTAMWLPTRTGTAYLTEAAAPWRCSPYLRVQVGELRLAMPVECMRPVLDALSALVSSAEVDR